MKHKRKVVEDFLVVGYEEGKGRRAGTVGALLLAEPDAKGTMRIVGSCGTGFTDATLDMLMDIFRPLVVDKTQVPRQYVIKVGNAKVTWLRTPVKATVEYAERTNAGGVRGPAAFKGLAR
jgi:bifunctional non-homologous end joining protein LigD